MSNKIDLFYACESHFRFFRFSHFSFRLFIFRFFFSLPQNHPMDYFEVKEAFQDDGKISDIKYKRCGQYIVMLQLLPTSKTNESREVDNPLFAKYRANRMKCLLILNTKTKDWVDAIQHHWMHSEVIYAQSMEVCADNWTENVDIVCGHGIHYFNTLFSAYFYDNFGSPQILFGESGNLIRIRCLRHSLSKQTCPCYREWYRILFKINA